MNYIWGKATVKLLTAFQCLSCKTVASGSTKTVEIERFEDLSEIKYLIDRKLNPSNCMPIGWSCHGLNRHYCPSCKGEIK